MGQARYQDHLKLTTPLLVLNVVTDATRMAKMVTVAGEHAADGLAYHLFQTWPAFGSLWRPPVPHTDLLRGASQRAGLTDFRVDQA